MGIFARDDYYSPPTDSAEEPNFARTRRKWSGRLLNPTIFIPISIGKSQFFALRMEKNRF